MNPKDQALIDAVVKQDCHFAFAELVKRYQSPLRYSLRQLTGWNEALADDIAQETFIKAYKALASFQGKSKFSSWLYRIAYNLMLSHFRVARNRELSGGLNGQEQQSLWLDNSREPVTADPSLQLHRDLAKAMNHLNNNQRMALHLSLHRECTQQEISDIMNIPLGTVKSLITRGKALLREQLADWKSGDNP
jgi:RNA polymerase sigma factor (sigma-70 family)|tara:strand:- start:488 stop:1063 length:576 start_codon:yes stop_codon:yes gene_type:complete